MKNFYFNEKVNRFSFPVLMQFKDDDKVGYSIRIWSWKGLCYKYLFHSPMFVKGYRFWSMKPILGSTIREAFDTPEEATAALKFYQEEYNRLNKLPEKLFSERVIRRISI